MIVCPMKFSNPKASPGPREDGWHFDNCDGEGCAWWTKTQEQCAIRSINMALWAVNEKLEKLPEELAGLSP